MKFRLFVHLFTTIFDYPEQYFLGSPSSSSSEKQSISWHLICCKWKWMNGHISSSGHSGIHGNLAQRSSVLISQSHPCCIRASCWCNLPISFLAYLMIFSQVLVLPVKPFPKESFLFLCPKNLIIFCQITVFSNQPSRTSSSFLIEAFIPLWVHVTRKILPYHFRLNAVMYFASHCLIAQDSNHSVQGCWY